MPSHWHEVLEQLNRAWRMAISGRRYMLIRRTPVQLRRRGWQNGMSVLFFKRGILWLTGLGLPQSRYHADDGGIY
jgi:hypothetical protein